METNKGAVNQVWGMGGVGQGSLEEVTGCRMSWNLSEEAEGEHLQGPLLSSYIGRVVRDETH